MVYCTLILHQSSQCAIYILLFIINRNVFLKVHVHSGGLEIRPHSDGLGMKPHGGGLGMRLYSSSLGIVVVWE